MLITGGCGFIGSNLVRWLVQHSDHHVVNLDSLTYAGNPASLADLADHDRYQFIEADITDRDAMRTLVADIAPNAIAHLAAESHVDRSIDGPDAFIQTNVVGTFSMLDAAVAHLDGRSDEERKAFRFVHVSTDEVYGSLGPTGLFSETSPYDPHSPYAASKAASDHLARAWGTTYGLPVIVTNCSNNYGPRQFPEKLLPLMIIKCLHEEPLPVYGKGDNVRDWLHVDDHAAALQLVAERGEPGRTYNIGGNNEQRNLDLVTMVCDLMDELRPRASGVPHRDLIQFVEDRPGHDFRYAIDATRIRDELGWSPQHTITDGLRSTIEWYLANEDWWQPILDGSYRLERLGAGS